MLIRRGDIYYADLRPVVGNIVCIVIISNTDRDSDKEIYQMGYITGGV